MTSTSSRPGIDAKALSGASGPKRTYRSVTGPCAASARTMPYVRIPWPVPTAGVWRVTIGARREQVHVRLARERRRIGARVPGADGPDERERPVRAGAGERHQQRDVELGRGDRPGEHDARARQLLDGGIDGARLQRRCEQL